MHLVTTVAEKNMHDNLRISFENINYNVEKCGTSYNF